MIKVKRITTNSDFTYEDVEIVRDKYDGSPEYAKYSKKYCLNDYLNCDYLNKILIKTKDHQIKIIADWSLGIIELTKMNPPQCSNKIKQLVLSGELSFSPCWLISEECCNKHNIPILFKHQLTFVSDNILFLTRQQNMLEITL